MVEITDKEGRSRRTEGILDRSTDLQENSKGALEICLDKWFLEAVQGNYTSIEPSVFFKLPGKQPCLYLYLRRQQSFKQHGVLHSRNIFKLYEVTGMGGLNAADKEPRKVRAELKKELRGLRSSGVIGRFHINEADMLTINPRKKAVGTASTDSKKQQKLN